jgi:hypothetical protein
LSRGLGDVYKRQALHINYPAQILILRHPSKYLPLKGMTNRTRLIK